MKTACNVVRDLLILYEGSSCSEESRALVEEHLEECPECAEYLKGLRHTEELLEPEADGEPEGQEDEERAIEKSFRKIRRRWVVNMLLAVAQLPLLGLAVLGIHEIRGEGIAFSNLDDIIRCMRYLHRIEKGDFQGAAKCVDFSDWDYEGVERVNGMTEEEIEEYMGRRYVEKLQEYDSLGIYIDDIRYDWAYRWDEGGWCVKVGLDENYPDGTSQRLIVSLNGENMRMGALGISKEQTESMIYIKEILHLYADENPLGYGAYRTSFQVSKGEEALIVWNGKGLDADGTWSVALIHLGLGTARDISDSFLAGKAVEIPVSGEYAVVAHANQKEDVELSDMVEITTRKIGEE